MRPCDHDGGPEAAGCPVCRLYFHDPEYRAFWDDVPPPPRPAAGPCPYRGTWAGKLCEVD